MCIYSSERLSLIFEQKYKCELQESRAFSCITGWSNIDDLRDNQRQGSAVCIFSRSPWGATETLCNLSIFCNFTHQYLLQAVLWSAVWYHWSSTPARLGRYWMSRFLQNLSGNLPRDASAPLICYGDGEFVKKIEAGINFKHPKSWCCCGRKDDVYKNKWIKPKSCFIFNPKL